MKIKLALQILRLPLETTAVIRRMLAIQLLIPYLDPTAATVVDKKFVGIAKIQMFLQMSVITFLMVIQIKILVIGMITTTANIAATAKMRLQASHAM